MDMLETKFPAGLGLRWATLDDELKTSHFPQTR